MKIVIKQSLSASMSAAGIALLLASQQNYKLRHSGLDL